MASALEGREGFPEAMLPPVQTFGTTGQPWRPAHPARASRRRHLQVVWLVTWVVATVSVATFLLLVVYMSHHPMPAAPSASAALIGPRGPEVTCVLGARVGGEACSTPLS
jgi:hypothetical protein